MISPLVSIIMPVYNRAAVVARAVESVLNQSYTDWELLIVNDGSTDDTSKALEPFRARAMLIHQANGGPYVARNRALQQAKGKYVSFIDSDDTWLPFKLASQLPLFDAQDVGLVFGDAFIVDYRSGKPRRRPYTYHEIWAPSRGKVFQPLLRHAFIPQSSVMARRECFQKYGFFSLMGQRSADYAKWIQLAQYYAFDYVNKPVFELAIHGGNWSRNVGDLYQSQIPLFTELLNQAQTADAKTKLCHLLFDTRLRLWFSTGGVSRSASPDLSLGQRMVWFFQFLILQFKIMARLGIQKYDSRRWFAPFLKVAERPR